ncbi:RluA family pseudouridine synthase [Lactobacillus sp. DCY120]|uniref:Pseudouridine synthase n=1 Tax=Bombilactobacillus apium TaxID=2675299 RepID=A0A850R4N8_9LACO|nr:RluA family pseudouridine synthase [Bombilactobacillus apium]
MKTIEFTTSTGPLRLDQAISQAQNDYPRAQIQRWIKAGAVEVNQQVITKSGAKVQAGAKITVQVLPRPQLRAFPQDLPLDIVYEDQDVLVVNKPQGLVVHPAAGHPDHTLVNAILYHTQVQSDDSLRPGIVHRIDKDTSGLLMVAKTELAEQSLSQQLKDKTNLRSYLAIVHRPFAEKKGRIEAPIGRDPQDRKRQAVVANGKNAVTNFQVRENFANYALIECHLETGRTHQIRVHLQYIKHPVAGDLLYGPKKTLPGAGQFLHAARLGFYHPRTGEWLEFSVEPPTIFQTTLTNLRQSSSKNN